MITAVEQASAAVYLWRRKSGSVVLEVEEHDRCALIALSQQELHKLYCELSTLLVERPFRA